MTPLPSFAERAALNYTTAEVAFFFSIMALRRVSIDAGKDGKYYKNFQFSETITKSQTGYTAFLSVLALLPYSTLTFLENGGDALLSLLSVGILPFSLTSLPTCAAGTGGIVLKQEPPDVENLEKYCLWTAKQIQAFLLAKSPVDVDSMKIKVNQEGVTDVKESTIQVEALLPFDLSLYLSTRTYICSLLSLS